MTTALVLDRISYSFGERLVVKDASCMVEQGTVCGIVGPNGAGKSTLARLAAGVYQPTTGCVTVNGTSLRDASGPARARLVRVSFQTPEHELFRPTLGAEIDWEAALLGVDAASLRQRVTTILADCAAGMDLEAHPYDLDPWHRKLFSCVSALAVPQRLVILDEPTLRLGQQVRSALGVALRRHAAEGGAVLFVTHDHEFAADLCDTLVVVKGGEIAHSGPTDDVLTYAASESATNIYSFPSYFLHRAVQRRSRLPLESS